MNRPPNKKNFRRILGYTLTEAASLHRMFIPFSSKCVNQSNLFKLCRNN